VKLFKIFKIRKYTFKDKRVISSGIFLSIYTRFITSSMLPRK